MNSALNGQQIRSLATQITLMETAEALIAERGVHNVTIKDIVQKAKQKNPSVLQYHFKNLQGLINAIQSRRSAQLQSKRAEMLEQMLNAKTKLNLRDLCELMVYPAFLLLKSNKQFRNYAAAFSHEVTLAADSAFTLVSQTEGSDDSGMMLNKLLQKALPHLDDASYHARMDLAVRMCSAAMGNHVRQKKPLRGPRAEFFINNLTDALAGLLAAKVSQNA